MEKVEPDSTERNESDTSQSALGGVQVCRYFNEWVQVFGGENLEYLLYEYDVPMFRVCYTSHLTVSQIHLKKTNVFSLVLAPRSMEGATIRKTYIHPTPRSVLMELLICADAVREEVQAY